MLPCPVLVGQSVRTLDAYSVFNVQSKLPNLKTFYFLKFSILFVLFGTDMSLLMEFDATGQPYFDGQNFQCVENLFILFSKSFLVVIVIFLDHFNNSFPSIFICGFIKTAKFKSLTTFLSSSPLPPPPPTPFDFH